MRIHSKVAREDEETRRTALLKFVERQIALMDEVIEQLLVPCVEEGEELTAGYRSRGFDEYLATEWYVRRHDPDSVDAFRDGNDIVLERCDVTKLGVYLVNVWTRFG